MYLWFSLQYKVVDNFKYCPLVSVYRINECTSSTLSKFPFGTKPTARLLSSRKIGNEEDRTTVQDSVFGSALLVFGFKALFVSKVNTAFASKYGSPTHFSCGILKKVFSDLPDLSSHIPIDLLEDSLGEFTVPLLGLGSNVSFITSNRGKELLLYQGFKFGLHRRLACGGTSWSCCTRACPARLRCIGDSYTVTKARVDHNHPPPKPEKLERQKVYNAAKRKALETMSERPSNVISAVLSEETVDQLSKDDLARIRKNLHRARREHNKRLLKVFTDDLETNLSSLLNARSDDEFGTD